MRNKLRNFLHSEDGAVTADWVVLTAVVVTLAGTVVTVINGSTDSVGDGVGSYLTASQPGDM